MNASLILIGAGIGMIAVSAARELWRIADEWIDRRALMAELTSSLKLREPRPVEVPVAQLPEGTIYETSIDGSQMYYCPGTWGSSSLGKWGEA